MSEKDNVINPTLGDYFYCNGKLIKDNGLSINAKHVFEAIIGLNLPEERSVRTLVEEKGFTWQNVYSAVLELVTSELVTYDVATDKITLTTKD